MSGKTKTSAIYATETTPLKGGSSKDTPTNYRLPLAHFVAFIVCTATAATLCGLEYADPSSTRFIVLNQPYMLSEGIAVANTSLPFLIAGDPSFPNVIANTFIVGYVISVAAISPILLNSIFVFLAALGHGWMAYRKFRGGDGTDLLFVVAWGGIKTVAAMVSGVTTIPSIALFCGSEIAIASLYLTERITGSAMVGMVIAFLLQWLSLWTSVFASVGWTVMVVVDIYIMLGILIAVDLVRLVVYLRYAKMPELAAILLYNTGFATVSYMCYFGLLSSYPSIVALG